MKSSVIEALTKQYNVRKSVVYCEDDHRGKHALEDRPEYVEHITSEPYDNELNA